MRSRRHSLPLLATALALLAVAPASPVAGEGGETPPRTAEVMVEALAGGGLPKDLAASDLEVLEAGEPRPVLGLEPAAGGAATGAPQAPPWRLSLYFDTALSAESTVGRIGRLLEESAGELAALGWVEIVVAGDAPRLVLPATRSPAEIAAALGRLFLLEAGEDRLVGERRRALDELRRTPEGPQRELLLVAEAARETDLVRARLESLLAWLADRPAAGPRAVLLVGDGFDLDPAAALRGRLEELAAAAGDGAAVELGAAAGGLAGVTGVTAPATPPAGGAGGTELAAAVDELGRALATYGWVVVPVAPRAGGPREESRFGPVERTDPVTGDVEVLGSVRLPRRRSAAERAAEQARAAAPPPLPAAPLAPLDRLAEATGGEVVVDPATLPDVLRRLGLRVRLRFATQPRADGEPQPLTVSSRRRRLEVKAPRWIGWSTPRAVAALRARRLLDGDEAPGDLEVRTVARLPAGDGGGGRLEALVRSDAPAGLAGGPLLGDEPRLTLAALGENGVTVEHLRATAERAPGGELRLALPLALPPGVERLAVVVEDLATGRWGGALAGLVSARAAVAGGGDDEAAGEPFFDPDLGLLPAPKAVNLLRPSERVLRGKVRFETVVSDPAVARVEFLVDGRRQAEAVRPPFTAALELGRLPLLRRIEARAYAAGGTLVGSDSLVVNEGSRGFGVRITEPSSEPVPGPLDLAAEVSYPDRRSLERVEMYWNQRRLATLFAPPFRHRLVIPPGGGSGFLRVVAHLDDGSTAEDVFFLDDPENAARVEVNLVELYVVVSDRAGRPVRGLDRDAFEVREDGERQELADFSEAGDLPLTVGLAIDASASMFVKLPSVQEAASDFLAALEPGRDRAFVVGFGDHPRLAAEPTLDLARAGAAVASLASGGRTSLWESIVFSLVQLQGLRGRKALVVYSDGADEDADFRYRTCVQFARKVGIPVYVIVSNNEAVRTEGLGLKTFGDRLERLTSAVGGRVFLVRTGDDLSEIYRQIERELSSQYLVTYYSDGPPQSGAWRQVEVEVPRRGLTARTVSGYQF